MPSNPMQRKVRNSFLIGMMIMLLVALLIGALLFMVVVKPMLDDKKAEEGITYVSVYKLKTEVESGDSISQSMLESVILPSTSVPTDKIISSNDGGKTPIGFPGGKAKVDLTAGTILSRSLIMDEDEEETDPSARLVEYNMLRLPVILDIGDYVDVRITFANGQDLIVVAKKEVKEIQGNTITLELNEAEILLMTSATVEGYIMPTSDFYLVRYAAAGEQEAADITYTPTAQVESLINNNPNITKAARDNFTDKFSSGTRELINNQLGIYSDEDKQMNIETGIRQQIDAAKAARADYGA